MSGLLRSPKAVKKGPPSASRTAATGIGSQFTNIRLQGGKALEASFFGDSGPFDDLMLEA